MCQYRGVVEVGPPVTNKNNNATLTDVDPVIGGIGLSLLAAGVRHASGDRWNV